MSRLFKWKDCLSIFVSLAIPGLMNLRYACIKNGTRRDFLDTRHSLLSQFFLSLLSDQLLYIVNKCVCTHIWLCTDCIWITVATKRHCSETFRHKSVAVRRVDRILITEVPVWRWLGEYMTLDRTFQSLLFKQQAVAVQLLPHVLPYFKQQAVAAQLLPHVLPYRVPRGELY
jgi:hypothetical protein